MNEILAELPTDVLDAIVEYEHEEHIDDIEIIDELERRGYEPTMEVA